MAQKNLKVLKRKILVDGVGLDGLVKVSGIKDTEGTQDVATFGRTFKIKNGVKMFEPITLTYNLSAGSKTKKTLDDWKKKNEYHDVTVVNTDATGTEFDRWLLRDCECFSTEEPEYDAATPPVMQTIVQINCTTEPTRIDA